MYTNALTSVVSTATANAALNSNQTEQQSVQNPQVFIPILFNNAPAFQLSQLQQQQIQQQQALQQPAQPVLLVTLPFVPPQNLNHSHIFTEQQLTNNQNNAPFHFFNSQPFIEPQSSLLNHNLQSQSLQQQQNTSLQAVLIPKATLSQTAGTSAVAFANPFQPFPASVLQPH